MTDKIQIGRVGKIVEGDEKGEYIIIKSVEPSSDDFYIFISKEPNFEGNPFSTVPVYDYWIENEQKLRQFFEEAKWVVDWK